MGQAEGLKSIITRGTRRTEEGTLNTKRKIDIEDNFTG